MVENKKRKNKIEKRKQNKKIDTTKRVFAKEETKIIKCLVIVLIIFGFMYLVTTLILNHSEDSIYQKKKENTSIQYDEILLGTTFQKKDNEYLVLFYNVGLDTKGTYGTLISDYDAKERTIPIYYVDLGNAMNKSCLSSESNERATNASELKINDTTLIKFSNQNIEEYIVGEEEISNYLNK
ncbi:MAG: hypothetical protein HFJ12_05885 [Bacilli bacterium]|nr:hypothetical protein [Bacilli bacterium]